MSMLASAEGVLCLVGAADTEQLKVEIQRLQLFLEKSSGLSLIDVVFTATASARNKACVLGMWVASLDELRIRLRLALRRLKSDGGRLRERSGIFFSPHPLAAQGGKVAFIYPGTGSFHLEMMRDLALTFDGVREMFDDMEEAFAGFCDVASPSEWLFATAPEHTVLRDDSATPFLTLLAAASTFLASSVFTQLLNSVGVKQAGVAGIGLGAFSAYCASHRNPKRRQVQILRDAGKMLLRLAMLPDEQLFELLTISGVATDDVRTFCRARPREMILAERLTVDECVVCVTSVARDALEAFVKEQGGVSVAEPLLSPFNTDMGSVRMAQMVEQFFTRWVNQEPEIPLYSCVTGAPVKSSTSSVVTALVEQMMKPLDLECMIQRMYDDGFRIFVEVGARGALTPILQKILAAHADEVAVIPMNILHRAGGLQVGQALGALATQGLPIDCTGLRFFRRAKWLDFNKPIVDSGVEGLHVSLLHTLPSIRTELLDTRLSTTPVEQDSALDGAESTVKLPIHGTDFPLLFSAKVLSDTGDATDRMMRLSLRLEDYPYMKDFAIGTSNVSLVNPQLRGLTLFSLPSSLELMGEVARKLHPEMQVIRVEHLRAQRWISFDFGCVQVQVHAVSSPGVDGTRSVKVQLLPDSEAQPSAEVPLNHALVDVRFILAPMKPDAALPDAPVPDVPMLMNARLVNWTPQEIYPARLFQGPLLRNILEVRAWGLNGIDYTLQMPGRGNTVRALRRPLFSVMPLLFDAITSGFSLWRSHERFHGAISLPFRCRSVRYYRGWVREGVRMKASLRLVNVTPRSHQVDIYVTDEVGNLVVMVKGWEEISGRAARVLHDFVMNPSKHFITQPLPLNLLPEAEQLPSGVAGVEIVGALYENTAPDFFVDNQSLWMKALAYAVLSPTEREDFAEMTGAPLRKLEWLQGRIAAKEAVRRYLLKQDNFIVSSADIDIWKDDLGKPHPLGAWRSQLSTPLDLTIAHTSRLIVAAVVNHGRIGIDVERLGRDLTEEFLRGVFTIEEQELAAKSGDGPSAVLRFWCSKEAISKALGCGIRYAPTDLRIRNSDLATGTLQMELLGEWATQFPTFKGQLLTIKTGIIADHAMACCVLPPFPERH